MLVIVETMYGFGESDAIRDLEMLDGLRLCLKAQNAVG